MFVNSREQSKHAAPGPVGLLSDLLVELMALKVSLLVLF
jgi:hypothetical protein